MQKTKDFEICVDKEKLVKMLEFVTEENITKGNNFQAEDKKEILEILKKLKNNEKSSFEAIFELKNIAIKLIDKNDFFNAGRVSAIIAISASDPLREKLIEEIYKHVIEKEKSLSIREK
jgi:hypothetical protein